MSDQRLSSIGEKIGGAPDHLVERSAVARASAQGVSTEEVLQAWSGGEALVAGAVVETSTQTAEEAAPVLTAAPTEAEGTPTPAAPASVPVPTAVIEIEEPEPVEPVSWRQRVRLGYLVGALVGVLIGLVTLAASAPLVLGRLTQVTEEGGPAVEVTWTAVVATGCLWFVIGAVIALSVRGAGRFLSPSYDTEGTAMGGMMIGGLTGLVVGFVQAGGWYAWGEATLTGTKLWTITPLTFIMILVVDAFCGAVVGGVTQFFSQPASLPQPQSQDSRVVKKRIYDSLAIPLVAGVVVLIFVVAFGTLLVQFPSFAPLVAILASIGILFFAGFMASRPNLRVTKGEVLAAAAGVGVVLLMLALIASALSGDGGHGSEDEGDHAISITF